MARARSVVLLLACTACGGPAAMVHVAKLDAPAAPTTPVRSDDPCAQNQDEACGERLDKSGDRTGALRRYQSACDAKQPLGCHKLATLLLKTDPNQAFRLEQGTCATGHLVASCSQLAWMKLNGVGCEADVREGALLLADACTRDDWFGCITLGVLYRDGTGVPRDYAKAVELFTPYCPSVPYACDNLGVLYELGWGVQKDEAKAVSLYKLACDRTFIGGCRDLAKAYLTGHGVAQNDAEGLRLLRFACEHDHAAACYELGEDERFGLHGLAPSPAVAYPHFVTACAGGVAEGCNVAGWLLHQGDGVAQDSVKAVSYFQRACDGGDGYGCTNLGVRFLKGEGVATDVVRAARLFDKACTIGLPKGCEDLGRAYERGEGVAKDLARSQQLYDHACADGAASACDASKRLASQPRPK